jgi:hypothetical protein
MSFDFDKIESFCDVGCANGPLLFCVKKDKEHIKTFGIEYFYWQKENANQLIKNDIKIFDLRDDLDVNEKYDIVNCTETGEHIDPEYCDVFVNNLKKITGKYLIISWSDSGGIQDVVHDQHVQHLNPLKSEEVEDLMLKNGFIKNNFLTDKFLKISEEKNKFYFWWRKSLGVYEKK